MLRGEWERIGKEVREVREGKEWQMKGSIKRVRGRLEDVGWRCG